MSSAPLPLEQPRIRLADQPVEAVALHLLDLLIDKTAGDRLREVMTDLGHMLSPHELGEIYQFIAAMTTEDGRAQIAAYAPMWSQLRNGAGAVFSHEVLFEGSVLFRSAVQAREGAGRPALVCFTSRQNGMFMPNCRFLELLGRYPVDVVMNWTDSGTFGLWAVDGAGSFAGSLARLKAALAGRGIRARVYAGASAGCGPAVYAATLDPGTKEWGTKERGTVAVLFGCRFYVPGRNIPLAQAGPAFEPICDCWQGPKPEVHNIFGGLQPIDLENDARLQALLPGARSYPLPGDDKHSPMTTLTARRKLRPVIDLMVQAASGIHVNFEMVTRT